VYNNSNMFADVVLHTTNTTKIYAQKKKKNVIYSTYFGRLLTQDTQVNIGLVAT
jgi:hypothetical protein